LKTAPVLAGWAVEGVWEILNQTPEEREKLKEEIMRHQASDRKYH